MTEDTTTSADVADTELLETFDQLQERLSAENTAKALRGAAHDRFVAQKDREDKAKQQKDQVATE